MAAKEPARRPVKSAVRGWRTVLYGTLLALAAPAWLARAEPPTTASAAITTTAAAGPVVAIGGALRYDNDAVWSRLVALAGGPGSRFVVLATAAANPERSAQRAIAALEAHGARAVHVRVAPQLPGIDLERATRDPQWIAQVRGADGLYFTGGAQERIVDTLRPGGRATPLLDAIREMHQSGGVIAGTSAGAAILSRVMFRDATDSLAVMKGALRDGKEVDRGLGFVDSDLFVDQHFLRRGRLVRMLPLMLSRGQPLGLGVEENSAAIIRGDEVEVLGPGGALFVDLTEAQTDPALGTFNVSGARLTFLGDGDRLDVGTRTMTPSAAKLQGDRIDPNAPGFAPELGDALFLLDMLGEGAVLRAMSHVLDGRSAEVRGLAFDAAAASGDPQGSPGFEFRFSRRPDTAGWFSSGAGGEDYSIANVRLDVTPVRVAQPLYRPWK